MIFHFTRNGPLTMTTLTVFRRLTLCAALLAAPVAFAQDAENAAPEEQFVTIGTGGVTGVYYPTGGAIQLLVNRNRAEHGIRITVESTGGSVFNLNALAANDLDIGVAQSDWHHHAYHGSKSPFEVANPGLRSLFSLHPEPFTLVARAEAGIAGLDDLPGKRVNIGNPGSGQRATMEVVMEAMGWTEDDFTQLSELTSSEQAQALCDGNFDAMVFAVGHPSASIQEAAATCDVVVVPVEGPEIQALVDSNDFYAFATIPGGTYDGTADDVRTFGVRATLVTTAALPDVAAKAVLEAVFDNFAVFQRSHPAFGVLTPAEMATEALSAPLHPAAEAYFQEAGLLGE